MISLHIDFSLNPQKDIKPDQIKSGLHKGQPLNISLSNHFPLSTSDQTPFTFYLVVPCALGLGSTEFC